MAKPKSPLLSLGARGTIGDTLTFQKRGREHIARAKPIPRDPYSLNQAYQRWDYRDYAYQWTLLTNSEKQVYRSKASRYHITGFSQFMREQLKTLPDLAGRWHLDERSGAIAYDSSRNDNNGIIIGASPIAGLIAGACHADGLNDRITIPHHASLDITPTLTIAFFIRGPLPTGLEWLISKNATGNANLDPFSLYWFTDGQIRFRIGNGIAASDAVRLTPVVADNAWHHVAFTADGTTKRTYHNGNPEDTDPQDFDLTTNTDPIILFHWSIYYADCDMDELILANTAFDAPTIKRLSERRYLLS